MDDKIQMVSMKRDPDPDVGLLARSDDDYDLQFSLDEQALAKLNLDPADAEIGAELHIFALCKVISRSQHEHIEGARCCVRLQITDLAVESEDEENAEADQEMKSRNWYGGGEESGGDDNGKV